MENSASRPYNDYSDGELVSLKYELLDALIENGGEISTACLRLNISKDLFDVLVSQDSFKEELFSLGILPDELSYKRYEPVLNSSNLPDPKKKIAAKDGKLTSSSKKIEDNVKKYKSETSINPRDTTFLKYQILDSFIQEICFDDIMKKFGVSSRTIGAFLKNADFRQKLDEILKSRISSLLASGMSIGDIEDNIGLTKKFFAGFRKRNTDFYSSLKDLIKENQYGFRTCLRGKHKTKLLKKDFLTQLIHEEKICVIFEKLGLNKNSLLGLMRNDKEFSESIYAILKPRILQLLPIYDLAEIAVQLGSGSYLINSLRKNDKEFDTQIQDLFKEKIKPIAIRKTKQEMKDIAEKFIDLFELGKSIKEIRHLLGINRQFFSSLLIWNELFREKFDKLFMEIVLKETGNGRNIKDIVKDLEISHPMVFRLKRNYKDFALQLKINLLKNKKERVVSEKTIRQQEKDMILVLLKKGKTFYDIKGELGISGKTIGGYIKSDKRFLAKYEKIVLKHIKNFLDENLSFREIIRKYGICKDFLAYMKSKYPEIREIKKIKDKTSWKKYLPKIKELRKLLIDGKTLKEGTEIVGLSIGVIKNNRKLRDMIKKHILRKRYSSKTIEGKEKIIYYMELGLTNKEIYKLLDIESGNISNRTRGDKEFADRLKLAQAKRLYKRGISI